MSIRDNVIANRTFLVHSILLDPILSYYKYTRHWNDEVFFIVCKSVLWNTNQLCYYFPELTDIEKTILLVIECSRIVIDEWIYSLCNEESHPIITALILTGQSRLLTYIYPMSVAIAA